MHDDTNLPDLLRNTVLPAIRTMPPGRPVWGQTDHPYKSGRVYPMPPYVREFYPHNRIIKFCYLISGTCALRIGNQTYVMPEGGLGIVRRNRFNYEACLSRTEPYMLIWFTLHTIDELTIRLCRFKSNNYELNIESIIMRMRPECMQCMETALDPAAIPATIQKALWSLTDYVSEALTAPSHNKARLRHTVRDNPAMGRRQKQIVKDVLSFIRSRFREKIYLKDAAALSGLHPNYLEHLITQVTGSSFKRHLSHYRLKEAHRLLNKPHRNIAEIAYQCGFNDPYGFSHFFKRYTGISPKMFRDRYYGAL